MIQLLLAEVPPTEDTLLGCNSCTCCTRATAKWSEISDLAKASLVDATALMSLVSIYLSPTPPKRSLAPSLYSIITSTVTSAFPFVAAAVVGGVWEQR